MSTERETHGDVLVHALAAGGQLRVLAAVSTGTCEEARRRHGLYPTAAAALGRLLTGAALLAAGLKGEDQLSIHVVGDGPLRYVVAAADAHGHVRGYVGEPQVHLPLNAVGKLDVGGAVGRGQLHVIRDLGLKEPYRGTVPLVSGEIGDDLAYYLTHSEQTPSAVLVGVLVEADNSVRAAGGLILQRMPGSDPALVDDLERRLLGLGGISRLVDAGARPEDIVHRVVGDLGVEVLDRRPMAFHCPCSRERFERALVALGPAELTELAQSADPTELVCHFCSTQYSFSPAEIDRLRQLAQ